MKNYLKHYLALFLVMGCVGIAVEIFFTSIYDLVKSNFTIGYALKGQSYVWMFPLYGLTALTFPPLIKLLDKFKWWGRALVKGVGILIIEYIAGFALQEITGSCPWEYKEGYHLHGFIRFDYYPFWVLFAFGIERVIRFLHPKLSSLAIKEHSDDIVEELS